MAIVTDQYGNVVSRTQCPTNNTTTVTEDKKETIDEVEEEENVEPLFVQTPIFILFAEYLGYVSSFVEHAENWCDPKKPMPKEYMQIFLEREARTIYDEMLEAFTEDEIHSLYVNYYPLGLDCLDEDLKEKRKDNGDDLPF